MASIGLTGGILPGPGETLRDIAKQFFGNEGIAQQLLTVNVGALPPGTTIDTPLMFLINTVPSNQVGIPGTGPVQLGLSVPLQFVPEFQRRALDRHGDRARVPSSVRRQAAQEQSSPGEAPDIGSDAFAIVRQFLARYDLQSLEGFALDALRRNGNNLQLTLLELEDTPEFKERFQANEERRKLGLSALSPEEIIRYEQQARGVLRRAGLPSGFYDQFDDFVKFIVDDVSISELQERVNLGFERVAFASPEVRGFFADFYGAHGDAALAAYFLDPERATAVLRQQVATVETAALVSTAAGFPQIHRDTAREIAGLGLSSSEQLARAERVRSDRFLADETFSERVDISLFDIVEGNFGLDSDKTRLIERRRQRRVAALSALGSPLITNEGVLGLRVVT